MMEGIDTTGSNKPGPAIVDSGTTLLLLQEIYYNQFVKMMQYVITKQHLSHIFLYHCIIKFIHVFSLMYFRRDYSHLPGVTGTSNIFNSACLTKKPSSAWPNLDIQLAGALLSIPADLYFLEYPYKQTSKAYCLGIATVRSELNK